MNSEQIAGYFNKQIIARCLEFQARRISGDEEISDKGKPYEGEPNYKIWIDKSTGYHCLIRRNPTMKFLTGYVAVTENIKVDPTILTVHGGITYNEVNIINFDGDKWCKDNDYEILMIDGLPSEFTGRLIGFDCAHKDDYALNARFPFFASEEGIYRDINYVSDECESLAKQIKDGHTTLIILQGE